MKRTVMRPLLFITLMLAAPVVMAEVSVTLELDRREATLADAVALQVHVSGARKSDTPPTVSGLEPFLVTPGGSASRIEILDGRYHSGVDYTYYLQPRKKGVFQVGPARVEVSGKNYESNVATLTVVEGNNDPQSEKGAVFLMAELGDSSSYVEQQVPYTLKLFLRANVSDISLDLPEKNELTFRQLEKPKEYQTVYDGASYRVLEVSYGIVPLKAGRFRIPPARMGMTVYIHQNRRPKSLFDDPFFSGAFRTGRPLTVESEPVTLEVRPLPEEGKPPGFTGLVGRFFIEGSLSAEKVRVGDSVTLTIHLKGEGNVNRFPDMEMPPLKHLKTYADEPVLETRPGTNGLTGSKIMKWALVPDHDGDYTISPFSISYFDPEMERYRIQETRPLVLRVLPGDPQTLVKAPQGENAKAPANHSQQAVKEIGHDILPIYTSASGLNRDGWFSSRILRSEKWRCWIFLVAPFVVYGAVFLGLRFNRKSQQAVCVLKAKKAAQRFAKDCRREDKDAHGMMMAVKNYINDRFQLSIGSLTPADVPKLLVERGIQSQTAQRLQRVLEELEGRIYTGGDVTCESAGQRILKIVRQIEKELR